MKNLTLEQQYYIDGDDGNFNDEVAGDGYYTSIQMFIKSENKSSLVGSISMSDKFKFQKQFQIFTQNAKHKVSCKFRKVTCPKIDR